MTWVIALVALAGVWLNIKKDSRCFILWTFTNGFWCVYDYHIGATAQSVLFFVYFVLALYGLYEWRKGAQHETR